MFILGLILAIVTPFVLYRPLKEWYALTGKQKPSMAKWTCFAVSFFLFVVAFIPYGIIISIFTFLGALGYQGVVEDEKRKQAEDASLNNTTSWGSSTKQPRTSGRFIPDRRFSDSPANRSAKGMPATGSIVMFDYTNSQGEYGCRTVRVSRCGRTYLDGYDLDKYESRTFRLDRIEGAVTDIETGEVFYL